MLSSLLRSTLVAATLLGSLGVASAAPRDAAGVVLVDHRGERHDRWERHERPGRHGHWDRGGPHRGDRHGRWERDVRRGPACSPRLALRKARDLGLRGADVVRYGRNSIVVAGYKRGQPTTVRFAQDRGCPVIGYR